MMSIAWIIFGYLVIGVIVSWISGKTTYVSSADHVLYMYLWPIVLLVLIFILFPARLFDIMKDVAEERKAAKQKKILEANCEKCARNNEDRCPKHLRPWTKHCYKSPMEVNDDETK